MLGKAIAGADPLLTRLIERHEVLIQVTLRADESVAKAPQKAFVDSAVGTASRAHLSFASAAATDPHIQGESFLYTAAADGGLLPGMNVMAFVPTGKASRARMCRQPRSSGCKAAPGPISAPARKPSCGARLPPIACARRRIFRRRHSRWHEVVVSGAQMLLSEEFRAQIQTEE